MADIRSKVNMLYSLEQLSAGQTVIHRIHPLAKLLVTVCYLVCVASLGRYSMGSMTPFLFYPAAVMALAELPYRMILPRMAAALPFCLFAGISNLLFDRTPLFVMGNITVSGGLVALPVLLLRCLLCVSVILILVAVTPFQALVDQLRRLHIPVLLVTLLEMTYRYIGVLAEEAAGMITAYRLRGNGAKWPDIRHFGPFVGQLLLRSADRAERVYQAMQCRLYTLRDVRKARRRWLGKDWVYLALGCGSSLLFRFFHLTAALGGMFPW